MIYLDNSATTMIHPEVLKTYTDVATKIIGNPSSLHNLGATATRLLEASRKQIADLLSVKTEEILFTSGGSEGNNWILKGVAFQKRAYGNHIIVSNVEHPSVKSTAEWLRTEGFEVDFAPVDVEGRVKVEELENLIREETILISVMAVNNEIGSIQPIDKIAALLNDKPTINFHVDAVQGVGKVPVESFLLDRVDFATFSAHKFHGTRGVGFIYAKEGKRLTPLIHGGGQEAGRRATTENLAGISATAKALRIALEDDEAKRKHVSHMKEIIRQEINASEKTIMFSGTDQFVPHILTWGISGVRGEVVVHAFEEYEIYLSTTSACSSKKNAIAGTLSAMNVKANLATSAVRISLDSSNTMAEIEQFLTIYRKILNELS